MLCQHLFNITQYSVQRDDIKEVREHYKQHGDIDMALRNFPRHLVAERSIVSVLVFHLHLHILVLDEQGCLVSFG
jgi:tRNA(Glu) U13 pseudouridine synthase TruD